jgi:hypothetical protein
LDYYSSRWELSVFQSEHLLIFVDDEDENVLLIPKRSFTSEKQLDEFLEIAYQKTVTERSGDVAKSAGQSVSVDSR